MKKIIFVILNLFFIFSFFACSKSQIVNSWKDPSYTKGPVTSILVIAITRDKDSRRTYEEAFARTLREQGVDACACYQESSKDPLEKKDILAIVRKLGVKYVLITTVAAVDKETIYHPAQTYVVPRSGLGYYGYYYNAYDIVHSPAYKSTNLKVSLETTLYDVKTEKRIWTAHSQTMNPESSEETIKSVIPELVKAMKKDGLIP